MTTENDLPALGLMSAAFLSDPHGSTALNRAVSPAVHDPDFQGW